MEHSKTRARRVGLAVSALCVLLVVCAAIALPTASPSVSASPVGGASFDPLPAEEGSADYEPAAQMSADYPDVRPSSRCAQAVAELSRRGCINGYEDGSFWPGTPITRQQFSKVLVLALGLAVSEDDVCPFSDVFVGGPSSLYPDNRLAADENFSLPSAKDREKGIKLRVHLPEGKKAATDSILIMALLQPFHLVPQQVQKHSPGVYDGRRTFMQDVIREIVTIPPSDRSEKLIQYEIRKNGKGI